MHCMEYFRHMLYLKCPCFSCCRMARCQDCFLGRGNQEADSYCEAATSSTNLPASKQTFAARNAMCLVLNCIQHSKGVVVRPLTFNFGCWSCVLISEKLPRASFSVSFCLTHVAQALGQALEQCAQARSAFCTASACSSCFFFA